MDSVEQHVRSGQFVRDLNWLNWPINQFAVAQAQRKAGDSLVIAVLMEGLHQKRGVQMRVSKEVSDDMLLTDIGDLQFDDVAWPAQSIELFFEDPTLPTFLVSKCEPEELEKLFGIEISNKRPGRVMARLDTERTCLTLNLNRELWGPLFLEGKRLDVSRALPLSDVDNQTMNFMLRLAFKVFAYATLPRYVPENVTSITRAMGGKPGFKGRPNRPAKRVVYLPSVHTPREVYERGEPTGRQILERRGFFRTYRHARYVNMRGKVQFIAPIKRGDVAKPTTFIVK